MSQYTLLGRISIVALYVSIAVAFVAMAMFVVSRPLNKEIKLFIGGHEVLATVADTPASRTQGLSGTKPLGKDKGMLFIFDEPGYYGFWMKDMLYSIDIIWLDDRRMVVDLWENANPSSYPVVRKPSSRAKYVLEVDAGFVKENMLKAGDMLEIK